MNVPFVDLGLQYRSIKSEIDAAVANVISDCAFIQGPYAEEFERQFAKYAGTEHCVACANGTDALEIALKGLGVGPGDEVIVPANTWISTAEAVTTAGGRAVFADPDPTTYCLTAEGVKAKLTERTKGVIPVHLYGHPAEMTAIAALARQHGLFVLEDCAQAHGCQVDGKPVGSFGNAATFSFYPGKNLGAYGDAGAIVTSDQQLFDYCRVVRNHGREGKFDHSMEGRNSRMDGMQAAILSAKLPYLEEWTERRREHAAAYQQALQGADVVLPVAQGNCRHVYHLYVIRSPRRDDLRAHLDQLGIGTGIHYPVALPFLKAYADRGHTPAEFPVAHAQMNQLLSLPMFAELEADQIRYVADAVKSFS